MKEARSTAGKSMAGMSDRNKKLAWRVIQGETMAAVAKEARLSKVRLSTIVRAYCGPYFMPSEWVVFDKPGKDKVRTNVIAKKLKEVLDSRESIS